MDDPLVQEILSQYFETQNVFISEFLSFLNDHLDDQSFELEKIINDYKKKLDISYLKLVVISLHLFGYLEIDFDQKTIEISKLFLKLTKSNRLMVNIFKFRMNMLVYVNKSKYLSLENKLSDYFYYFLEEYYKNVK
jgi:hypothetical protein